jgi:hypothetical protein
MRSLYSLNLARPLIWCLQFVHRPAATHQRLEQECEAFIAFIAVQHMSTPYLQPYIIG